MAGLLGCILVDLCGVRSLSLGALLMAFLARGMLAFGRSQKVLYVGLFVCSPLGDALMSIGLYRVALKKVTTKRTRALGFAVSYAVQNLAGVCVAVLVDGMRRFGVDWRIGRGRISSSVVVFTPVRQFVVSSTL